MMAPQAISSALLTLHDDDTPSDEFQFESEYVKSLLKQKTPSPIIHQNHANNTANPLSGKENIDRWRTPVTIGAQAGRTILGQRDMNAKIIDNTPAVKSSSTLGHSTTRYPRRGRLTRLGPPKRTSRLSSDSMETPSEIDTPPESEVKSASLLSVIPSSGTDEVGLRGIIQKHHAVLNVNGQYTPPASQSPPKVSQYPSRSPEQYVRDPSPAAVYHREVTPPVREISPRITPKERDVRRVSSSSASSSSGSTRVTSASKSLGRSSLRNLIASTSQKPIDVALEGVQKGLEALNVRKEDSQHRAISIRELANNVFSDNRHPSPVIQREVLDPNSLIETDITQEYIPPPGVAVNILPTRRKSKSPKKLSSPSHVQVNHGRNPSIDVPVTRPRVASAEVRPRVPTEAPPLRHRVVSTDAPIARPHVLSTDLPSSRMDPIIPPPPKMRGLSSQSPPKSPKQKGKAVVLVNDRPYTRLSTIGRGGSSKVYKVISTANNKIYALKKVSFDKADNTAIAGYKNEIRLLNRMAEREDKNGEESRCIRLFDWQSCDSKGYLLMLMECGEIDFAHILSKHQGVPLGLNFIRVYWEQMLRAVQVVHDEKIVHSDLKPANFLLVQGQLKLIDFGIAKRMGDDTTNIHRDQQIGTVNYMSPEAILDTNHNLPPGTGRLMKLGKKSDVWSLGCILYQMIYGKTPFSDLTMYQKIQSIPDENHPIKFPATGTGGVKVDRGAERCVRMCLVRDQKKRWGIDELLRDRFLCGEGEDERFVGITVEEIGSLIDQTLGFGRMNGGKMLSKETIETLAKDAFEKLRQTRSRD